MKQEGLKFFTDTYLTSLGLLIFFLFFVGVLIWVYRKNSSKIYHRMEQLPLTDGDSV
ncbi:CcoQ/FixQ family Cbb3-type cytochrome c oxidase assembly chaperone [Bdellovibrio bacteriovorus]|uniref:CcoQ/FixQ family Cbb3-type cytochrome c oxidase assembly chaperone n=1 Tax=Bdellovibrio bacteriovorus TaxID=959 RepID=UPI0009BED00F|nr:CcoQ/FixQ family Cbb3-type cytochrome c oxidase assembly chaperone [Bdellovibrio bacteriovorus]